MNRISIDGYEMELANSWDELSKEQVLRLCRVLMRGGKTMEKHVLMVLMDVKRGIFKDGLRLKFLKGYPEWFIDYLSVNEEVTGWVHDSAALSNYYFDKLRVNGRTWYGPPGDMLTISVAEFVECHSYYTAYVEKCKAEKDATDLLDRMIATLYRPGRFFYGFEKMFSGFKIDRRAMSNEYRMEKRVRAIAKLRPELKMALLVQYAGTMEVFSKNFEYAFAAGGDSADGGNWIKLLMAMSGDIFGNYEETKLVDVYTFFMKVDDNIKQSKEMKGKSE